MKHLEVPVVKLLLSNLSLFILLLWTSSALAECEEWAAKVASVEGTVEAMRADAGIWKPARLNDTYCPGDQIRVLENSRADLRLANRSVMRLAENSIITLQQAAKKGNSLLDMIKGAANFLSRKPESLEVKTPYVVAGVRGTEFFVKISEDETFLTVFEGFVVAQNDTGSLDLSSGQSAAAKTGQAPAYRTVVRPRDAVNWALYYPPVMRGRDTSIELGLVLEAQKLLSVGKVDEAQAKLTQALEKDSGLSEAYALQSVIAVVQNDKEKALQLASKAVSSNPKSPAAHLALSYAKQAVFDLEGARDAIEEAVRVDEGNALAWARLAEIQAMFGDLDSSFESAQKAVEAEPNLSRSHTVFGFANLRRIRTGPAIQAFTKAIELDQSDPMARLGLGLAMVRNGNMAEGGREIEVAASLDPNNSLVRSYLGKVYYEERRGKLDEREYGIAKTLDPKDPTPWFYDAIALQTTNRPVEALNAYQESIELNDNRAVYRSRLLLDSDEAARSAGMARVYRDLGFEQRALVEGWNAVGADPSNHSAHRFLADSYSVRPRHEIARVSELLQSQLLQPNNITPIQPTAAESNLFLLSSSGAANFSFNEYNPVFNRDRIAFQASSLVGGDDTWSAEGILSGMYKHVSFSAGYAGMETDGYRKNNDQTDKIGNVFAQWEITPRTSIQAEYRYRDIDRGDTQLRFLKDDFRPDRRQETETKTGRIGIRHALSSNSTLIGNFVYQEYEDSFFDFGFINPEDVGVPLPPAPPFPFIRAEIDLENKQEGRSGEISHMWRSNFINLITGVGHFSVEQDLTETSVVTYPGYPDFLIPPITFEDATYVTEADITHTNLYVYSYIKPLERLTLTLGASGDFFEYDEKESNENDLDEDKFNPKFGVSWLPLDNTTLRAAAFRTLKRTLITDQTLEPTQIAGFNQFYDDFNATETWVYGIAADQKFSRSLFGGVEYTKRELEVPWFDTPDPPAPQIPDLKTADWEEDMARAYIYWAPHKWVGLKAEYRYEKIKRDEEVNFSIREVRTHSVPLGINFFHASGLSMSLLTTYYHQEGTFMREGPIPLPFEKGSDEFWLVDASLSYRLPKRYGFLSVGGTNLFDEKFQYADTDIDNPSIQPSQFIYAKLTLALP